MGPASETDHGLSSLGRLQGDFRKVSSKEAAAIAQRRLAPMRQLVSQQWSTASHLVSEAVEKEQQLKAVLNRAESMGNIQQRRKQDEFDLTRKLETTQHQLSTTDAAATDACDTIARYTMMSKRLDRLLEEVGRCYPTRSSRTPR